VYQVARREFFNPSIFSPYFLLLIVLLVGLATYLAHQLLFVGSGIYYLYLLMIIQVTPFLIQFGKQKFNFIGFTLFNHFFCFSVPKYNQVKDLLPQGDIYPESVWAIKELINCSIIMAACYYVFRTFVFYSFVEREKYQLLTLSRVQLFVVAVYVIGMPVIIDYLPSWALIFHFAAVAADMVLLMCAHSPENERMSTILRVGVFISAVLYFIKTGMLTMVGNLAGYLFIASCLRRQYRILFIPVLLTLLGSAIQVVKAPFRNAIFSNPTLGYEERLTVLGGLLYSHYVDDAEVDEEDENNPDGHERRDVGESLLHGFSRLGDDSLERVMTWTPSLVPFWEGSSYESIPYIFIPRVLWHDKPSRHIWNKFGRTYGILSEDDVSTSVAINYFAEGYMNFGIMGMYVVAVIMGFLIAGVERLSYYFLGGYFYFTFMAFLMPVMTYASDLGSVIQSIMIVSAVLFLFRKQFQKMALKDDYS
jgi:hypothetical protein